MFHGEQKVFHHYESDQITATSAHPNLKVSESLQNALNADLGIIVICPDESL